MSDPRTAGQYATIERQLLQWVDAGDIEIRFSYAHIAEMAPLAEAHIDLARHRAKCIESLCRRKALISHSDLAEAEANALATMSVLERGHVINNEGLWMPKFVLTEMDVPTIEEWAIDEIRRRQPEHSNLRKIKRAILDQHGRLRPKYRQDAVAKVPVLVRKLRSEFPMTEEAETAIREYLEGKTSKQLMRALLVGSLTDLDLLVTWYSLNWDQVSPLTRWLREGGSKLAGAVNGIRGQLEAVFETQRLGGKTDQQILNESRQTLDSIAISLLRRSAHKRVEEREIADLSRSIAMKYMPGLATSAHLLTSIMASSLITLRSPRAIKPSDNGDVFHSIYLPYVDVFRADGFVAGQLKSLNIPFNTRIVNHLTDLPEVLRQALASAEPHG